MITLQALKTPVNSTLVVDMTEALDTMRHIEQVELWRDILKHLSTQQRGVLHEELARLETCCGDRA